MRWPAAGVFAALTVLLAGCGSIQQGTVFPSSYPAPYRPPSFIHPTHGSYTATQVEQAFATAGLRPIAPVKTSFDETYLVYAKPPHVLDAIVTPSAAAQSGPAIYFYSRHTLPIQSARRRNVLILYDYGEGWPVEMVLSELQ